MIFFNLKKIKRFGICFMFILCFKLVNFQTWIFFLFGSKTFILTSGTSFSFDQHWYIVSFQGYISSQHIFFEMIPSVVFRQVFKIFSLFKLNICYDLVYLKFAIFCSSIFIQLIIRKCIAIVLRSLILSLRNEMLLIINVLLLCE